MAKKEKIMDKDIDFESIRSLIKKEWFIILIIFLFSLGLHIAYKNAGLFHFDSAIDVRTIENTVETGSLQYSYGWGAPAMIVIVGFFFLLDKLIFGAVSAETAYFFVTFLTAALSSVMLYLLVKKFASRFTSFGSALLFSVAPLWLSATTYPKTHSIAMFFSLLAGWLVLEAGEKDSWKYLIGSGLCAGIAIATRPIDGAFILIPFAMLYIAPRIKNKKLVFNKNKLSLINIAGFCIPFIGILLILMGPRVMMFGGISGFLAMMKIETRGGWLGLFSVQLPVSFSYMNTTITYLGWIGVLGGVSYLLKKRRIYTLSVLGVWFAIMFFYIGNLTVVDSRFLIPVLAPLCILMAFGCEWGYEKHKIIGIAALIVLMGSLFYVAHPLIKARHEYSGQKEFAEFVEMSTEPNSLVYSGDNYVFITRYGHRNTKYFGGGEENVNFMINTLLNKTNVYAVESSFYFMTPVERDLLSKYFIISYIGHAQNEVYQFSALQLRRYDEKLFKINLNETALQELVKSQDNAENGVQ